MSRKFQIVCFVIFLGIAGCESNAPVQSPDGGDFVRRVRDQAIKLEKAGDLSRAVYQWQIIAGMQMGDTDAKAQLKRLHNVIRSKTKALETKFEIARAAGNNKQQKLLALKLLALDGGHSTARDYLRVFEYESALVMQSQKDRDALQAQAMRQKKATQKLLAQKQKQESEKSELREKADKAVKLAAANDRKGDDLYRAGIKALSVDLDAAIALLSESLVYKPNNIQAVQQIERAKKMQATLRKIEQSKTGD